MTNRKSLFASAACAALATASAVQARAQSPQEDVGKMTWEDLVKRAQEAAKADPREGLSWALKAAAIRTSPSLRVFILGEQRAVGDVAGAYMNAKMCVNEAEANPQLAMREKILATCRAAVSELQPAIGQLAISLPPTLPEGFRITVNGESLAPAVLALPYPVNPGTVAIEATAPGYLPYRREVGVAAAALATVHVALPPEEVKCSQGEMLGPDRRTCVPVCPVGKTYASDGKHCCWPGQTWASEQNACGGAPQCPAGMVAQGGDCAVEARDASTSPQIPKPQQAPEARARSTAPLYVAGAGAALAIAGTAFWFISDSKYAALKTDCGGPVQCTQTRFNSDSSSVKTFDALAVTGWTGGAALLLGGVSWYFASAPSSGASSSVTVHLQPLGRLAVAVSGDF